MQITKSKLVLYSFIFLVLLLSKNVKLVHSQTNAYDLQAFLDYQAANQGNALGVSVPAIIQPQDAPSEGNGNVGSGQSFLLNGNTGSYWYQVGLTYDWGGPGCVPNQFQLVYAVVRESDGSFLQLACTSFSGQVNPGDPISMTMVIANGQVFMGATDTATGAYSNIPVQTSYGATQFIGTPSWNDDQGYPTGLMSEQYFNNPTWYVPGTQVVTYQIYYQQNTQPAFMAEDEMICPFTDTGNEGECNLINFANGQPDVTTTSAVSPSQNYVMNVNGVIEQYSNGGIFQTGLFSSLDLYVQNQNLQQNVPDSIGGSQIGDVSQPLTLWLQNSQGSKLFLGQSQAGQGVSDTLCDGVHSCPSPGAWSVNVYTVDLEDAGTQTVGAPITASESGINLNDCPVNQGGIINGFTGTATTPPACGGCQNGAYNPPGSGLTGVGGGYCNVFCPNGQDNYPSCNQCAGGQYTTGRCPSYCFGTGGSDVSCSLCDTSGSSGLVSSGDSSSLCSTNYGCLNGAVNSGCTECPNGDTVSGPGEICTSNPSCVNANGTITGAVDSTCTVCSFNIIVAPGGNCPRNNYNSTTIVYNYTSSSTSTINYNSSTSTIDYNSTTTETSASTSEESSSVETTISGGSSGGGSSGCGCDCGDYSISNKTGSVNSLIICNGKTQNITAINQNNGLINQLSNLFKGLFGIPTTTTTTSILKHTVTTQAPPASTSIPFLQKILNDLKS